VSDFEKNSGTRWNRPATTLGIPGRLPRAGSYVNELKCSAENESMAYLSGDFVHERAKVMSGSYIAYKSCQSDIKSTSTCRKVSSITVARYTIHSFHLFLSTKCFFPHIVVAVFTTLSSVNAAVIQSEHGARLNCTTVQKPSPNPNIHCGWHGPLDPTRKSELGLSTPVQDLTGHAILCHATSVCIRFWPRGIKQPMSDA